MIPSLPLWNQVFPTRTDVLTRPSFRTFSSTLPVPEYLLTPPKSRCRKVCAADRSTRGKGNSNARTAKRVFIIIFVPLSEWYSGRAPLSSNKRQQARQFGPKHCKLALSIYVVGHKVEIGSFTSTLEKSIAVSKWERFPNRDDHEPFPRPIPLLPGCVWHCRAERKADKPATSLYSRRGVNSR